MKNKNLITLLFLLSVFTLSKAQIKNEMTNEQKKLLVNSWYESPRESKGSIITFRLEKHKFESGIDLVGYEYSEIVIKKNQDFAVALWKWCSGDNDAHSGKWTITSDNLIALDFSTKKCQCEIKIIELEKDLLKVEIKQKQ